MRNCKQIQMLFGYEEQIFSVLPAHLLVIMVLVFAVTVYSHPHVAIDMHPRQEVQNLSSRIVSHLYRLYKHNVQKWHPALKSAIPFGTLTMFAEEPQIHIDGFGLRRKSTMPRPKPKVHRSSHTLVGGLNLVPDEHGSKSHVHRSSHTLVGGLNLAPDEHGSAAQKPEQAIKPQRKAKRAAHEPKILKSITTGTVNDLPFVMAIPTRLVFKTCEALTEIIKSCSAVLEIHAQNIIKLSKAQKTVDLEHNPVDDLPFLIALPFRVVDATYGLAERVTLKGIKMVLAPVRLAKSGVKLATSPFKALVNKIF